MAAAKLAGTLLPEIDELIVKSYPVVAGSGRPALDGRFQPTPFTPTAQDVRRRESGHLVHAAVIAGGRVRVPTPTLAE